MICERCATNVSGGRLVVRKTFAGFACYGCAEELKRIAWEERTMAKNGSGKKSKHVDSKKIVSGAKDSVRSGSLAALIDPLLLAGRMTVKEIAGELARKAAEAAKGKDLAANVRARMVSYTRKGWQVVKDDEKRVKLVEKKG